MTKDKLRIIPLGGLGEIGKNMMVMEFAQDMIIIDAGLMFPQEEMLGVDLVIPDISYIRERQKKLRAIIITHGHEDHTGALPYVLRELRVPIYCTRLTRGLISVKLKEHKLLKGADLRTVSPGEKITLGAFQVEFVRVTHSIPDSCGLAIRTPVGTIVHSGDFKLDHTPVMGEPTDLPRWAELGHQGVLLLLSDSTYAESPGYTPSEQVVGESLDRIMATASGRVIVATFASLISRIQQVIDAAYHNGRRVFVTGRSMVDNVQMALELGYLTVPENVLTPIDQLSRMQPQKVAIMTTGSQGEPTSALVRMASRDHRHIQIARGDTVVISASPIPGNDMLINRTIDNLCRLGAQVLHTRIADVHVRGHAAQEELKMLLSLVNPRFFIPIHGEYRHLMKHALLAQAMGLAQDNTFVLEDGDILELDGKGGKVVGRVAADHVYVDGLAVGVNQVVLRDRRRLASDGIIVVILTVDKHSGRPVGEPDVVARGFMDTEEAEEILDKARRQVTRALKGTDHHSEWTEVNARVRDALAQYLYQETRTRPMILPLIVEV
ncbi:MAG: ribonuclease J [Dehalococcoidia bacterium]|nr:ribonuclease J [Dehalococcoidia bacterium]